MAAPTVPAVFGGDLPEKERLAYEEGHDADIPSNEGVVGATEDDRLDKETSVDPEKNVSSNVSLKEPLGDVEKGLPTATVEEQRDPNVVDWDGPDDPMNPVNWSPRKKWLNIGVLSLLTLLTPLASSMFAPGVPEVLAEFHMDNENLATFVVSVYLLGFAM